MFNTVDRAAWSFAARVIAVKLLLATGLNIAFFPSALWPVTITGTVAIIVLVSIPPCLWVARQMQQKSVQNRSLQTMVDRDGLTNAASRDYFFKRMSHPDYESGIVLMIDIDHFKTVNDTNGHLAGDEILRSVAGIMQINLRDGDILCRFGGEEFLVFLNGASPDQAGLVAERIRTGIAAQTAYSRGAEIKVTVSVGSAIKTRDDHIDDAIKRADTCLYRAKAQGRDCTVLEWSGPSRPDTPRIADRPVRRENRRDRFDQVALENA